MQRQKEIARAEEMSHFDVKFNLFVHFQSNETFKIYISGDPTGAPLSSCCFLCVPKPCLFPGQKSETAAETIDQHWSWSDIHPTCH